MRLLINNTEQAQPREVDGTHILLFGRAPGSPEKRRQVTVVGFEPHFYALREEVEDNLNYVVSQDCIKRVDFNDDESLMGDELARITVPYPQDTREARELFDETWAADVPFTRRFRIDTGLRAWVEVPDEAFDDDGHAEVHYRELNPVEPPFEDETPTPEGVKPRVVTLDIEVDDRGDGFPAPGEERILSIVARDSYTDDFVAFYDGDGRPIEDMFPNGSPEAVDEVRVQPNERRMLIEFGIWFREHDPDLVTGWNADDFDIPHIIKRFEEKNVGHARLSPLGWCGVTRRGEPRIKGRTVYDLLEVYKKNSFTELRSYSLDDVAKEELGSEKIQFSGSYYDLYESEPREFLAYNARDVDLAAGINERAGVIEFRDVLRREVGVDFEDSYDNKDFIDMMCRRKLKEWGKVGPTRGEPPDDEDYEGAHVFDAHTGVEENVVGLDLASLYPYTMAMLNASPETKVDEDFDGPTAVADNGQHFRLDRDGLFKTLVNDAISLKAHYKEKKQNADSEAERARWEVKYNSAKTITNSLYGVTGWELFFLYDKDVAEAVTLTGQAVIKKTAEEVEKTGYDVLYGDTDSVYVKFPDDIVPERAVEHGKDLANQLNEVIYPMFAEQHGIPAENNLWEIEMEVLMERFFQAGRKKRYAYLPLWKDGNWLDDPEPSITGFASRRSDTALLTVQTEEKVLDAILSGNEENVGGIIYTAALQITGDDTDWDLIGIPGGLNQGIDPRRAGEENYYAFHDDGYPQDAHPRAVWNANKLLDVSIGRGDKPKRVYIRSTTFDGFDRQINVIAFEEPTDLEPIEDRLRLDTERMINTLLVRPLSEIASAVGVDTKAAVRGQTQTGLGAFA